MAGPSRIRLIDRNDTSLAIALVAGTLVIFQKPLRLLLDAAHEVELRYNIDLIPGLVVLVGAFAFHQYKKWQEAKAAATAAAADADRERQRSAELERLVAFGAALGAAIDERSIRQAFWRYMPAFARDRELWMLNKTHEGWETVLRDADVSPRSGETIEQTARAALTSTTLADARADGVLIGEDVCFPMMMGETVLGMVGVRNAPPLQVAERRALGAAVAILAGASRNVQLLLQARENSLRDPLTACFNRAYALEALTTELQRSKRTSRPVSVMMLDVDCFKRMNDEYGHLAGDAILATVADQLARTLRASDVKCRWGGDEFLIVLPDTPLGGAEHAGGSITKEVGLLRVATQSGIVSPTISVGVAVAEPGEADPMALIARADAALYKAKHTGRNRFVVASSIRAAG